MSFLAFGQEKKEDLGVKEKCVILRIAREINYYDKKPKKNLEKNSVKMILLLISKPYQFF